MSVIPSNDWSGTSSQPVSLIGITVVLALHLLAFFSLLQIKTATLPVQPLLLSATLLPSAEPPKSTAEVVMPVELPKPKPQITPPKPKSVASKPKQVQQPTQIAVPSESPAATPISSPAPAIAASTPPIATAAPSEPALTQPRFDVEYLDNPKPAYPSISRRNGEQGRVLLRVYVDTGGLAYGVELHTSSGYARLDKSALETVRRWKFVPAHLGDQNVSATVLVPIVFSLKG